jgi:replicative DNA helicase
MDNQTDKASQVWAIDNEPRSVLGVVKDIDARVRAGDTEGFQAVSTGFDELDAAIGGGFRPGQLALISGPAGVGKTSLMLQIARNIANDGGLSIFVCYEHETDYLAQRVISMESVGTGEAGINDGLRLRDIADLVTRYKSYRPGGGFGEALASDPRGARAMQRMARYGNNLLLLKGSSYKTTINSLANTVWQARKKDAPKPRPTVLFVDYLQKVASDTSHVNETARNIEEIEGLKEMALDQDIVVVAIVAAEVEGLKAQRLRLQHLLSSPAIAYEADIIVLMNEKYDIIDRRHIEYNRHNAEQYHQYVVLSVEKNRGGSDLVDLELKKQLQFCHFRTEARRVEEHLVSGRQRE